jgi:hypothetical protein
MVMGVLPLVVLGSYTTVVLFVCGLCLSARKGDAPAARHGRGADSPTRSATTSATSQREPDVQPWIVHRA